LLQRKNEVKEIVIIGTIGCVAYQNIQIECCYSLIFSSNHIRKMVFILVAILSQFRDCNLFSQRLKTILILFSVEVLFGVFVVRDSKVNHFFPIGS